MITLVADSNAQPKSGRVIQCTPATLRLIADQIESTSRCVIPGEIVFYPLCNGITLAFDPGVNLESFLRRENTTPVLEDDAPWSDQGNLQ